MIPLVWLSERRLCWDQSLLGDMFEGASVDTGYEFEGQALDDVDGAVVIVPARYWADRVDELNALLARLTWCVVFLTSDEESTFPWRDLWHPAMRLWIMTPRPELHEGHDRFVGEGWSAGTPIVLGDLGPVDQDRAWFFAGQVTHERRELLVAQLRAMTGGRLVETAGFTQGLERDAYLAETARSRIVPCPSGPATQDSFRLYEALEAGCVPIADDVTPDGRTDYWRMVHPDAPFPIIGDDWSCLPELVAEIDAAWPASANRVHAWWQRYKRDLGERVSVDIETLSGQARDFGPVTVLMPTSPIPGHPDTSTIAATIDSVRFHLPTAEIFVMIDGVRGEQDDRRPGYEEYARRLLWLCSHRWRNVTPLRFDEHHHQAAMTRVALDMVRTPTVLFVEHDTPIVTDEPIDWPGVFRIVGPHLDVVRFHHEANILEPHQHLMVDFTPIDVDGVPILRTRQWSQRPHVASTDYYRRIMHRHFGTGARAMIEDRMHSVAQSEPWARHRIGMYAPGTNLKRSLHLDGRGDDEKFPMWFA